MIVTGSRGADPTVRYLNFGTVWDASGYGIRDNAGTLEFKNDGGSWASIQSVVNSIAGMWVTSGNNIYNTNTGNVGIGTTNPTQRLDLGGGNIAMGYTHVHKDCGTVFFCSVACPAQKKVLGGGCSIYGAWALTYGFPDSESTWMCQEDHTPNVGLIAYAICADIR